MELGLRLIREKPLGALGGLFVLVIVLLAVLANVLAGYGYAEIHLLDKLSPPSAKYLLGADQLGRDMLSRILFGARVSIYVGLGAVTIGTLLATAIGVISGYYGGKVDMVIQRVVDAFMSFPNLVILLTIMFIMGRGLINVIAAIGFIQCFQNVRVVRSAVLTVTQAQFVEAARAVGSGHGHIMWRHILPNVLAPVVIVSTLGFAQAILTEASLSFLGVGVPPPEPSWGQMLSSTGIEYMYSAPWLAVWPGVAISVAVFGFNVLGDALRDLLDPRLRGGGQRFG